MPNPLREFDFQWDAGVTSEGGEAGASGGGWVFMIYGHFFDRSHSCHLITGGLPSQMACIGSRRFFPPSITCPFLLMA